MQYNTIACGGTFDHFHKGHEAFLYFAFSKGEKVVIGLTTDLYVQEYKKNKNVEPFIERKYILEKFFKKNNLLNRAEVIGIDNPLGIAVDPTYFLDAIVVTKDSKNGADVINKSRLQKNLSSLPILIVPLVAMQGVVISSSAIRTGVINEKGEQFINSDWLTHTYILPDTARPLLQKPFGKFIENVSYNDNIITVGDVTTKRFLDLGNSPILSVVDFFVERKKLYTKLSQLGFTEEEKVFRVVNPAGAIDKQVWSVLQTILSYMSKNIHCILQVDGEEDLLVLPIILLFPLGFSIVYGQPGKGLVEVEITLATKQEAKRLFGLFLPKDY